jgi:hypothetical protein
MGQIPTPLSQRLATNVSAIAVLATVNGVAGYDHQRQRCVISRAPMMLKRLSRGAIFCLHAGKEGSSLPRFGGSGQCRPH